MQTEIALLNDLEKQFLCVCRTKTIPDDQKDIELDSFDEVIRFAKRNQIFSIFYHYTRIDADDLMIDDDLIKELHLDDEAAQQVVACRIEQYNARVEKLDYSRPVALYLFCVYQGQKIFAIEDDHWFKNYGFEFPQIAAIKIADDALEAIVEARNVGKQRREAKRTELKSFMLHDPVFQRCTNHDLRRQYWSQLVEIQPEIRDLFRDPQSGSLYDVLGITFAENVWREYKAR